MFDFPLAMFMIATTNGDSSINEHNPNGADGE